MNKREGLKRWSQCHHFDRYVKIEVDSEKTLNARSAREKDKANNSDRNPRVSGNLKLRDSGRKSFSSKHKMYRENRELGKVRSTNFPTKRMVIIAIVKRHDLK